MKFKWIILCFLIVLFFPYKNVKAKDYILYGKTINSMCHQPKSCCQQAMLYAEYLGGKVMSNGTHCFAVKDEKIYDSTYMRYTGFSIHSWRVQKVYGKPKDWKELKR